MRLLKSSLCIVPSEELGIPLRYAPVVLYALSARIERSFRHDGVSAEVHWHREPGVPGDTITVRVRDPLPPKPVVEPLPAALPESFTLAELAEYTGLSKRQIRRYSIPGIGVLWPRNQRGPRGQVKVYSRTAARRLLVCIELRQQGMTLRQMREYFKALWARRPKEPTPCPEAFHHPPWTLPSVELVQDEAATG